MADQHTYVVTIEGHDYEVSSPTELTDTQAYQVAQESHASRTPKEVEDDLPISTRALRGAGGLAMGVVKSPVNLVKGMGSLVGGVASGAKDIWEGRPPQSGKDLLDSLADLKNIPGRFMTGTSYERGEMLGSGLGNAAMMRIAPMTPRPVARGVGTAVEGLGKHAGWPLRISGSHALLGGNPVGAALMAAPEYIERTGRGIRQWGEREPRFIQKELQKFDRLAGTDLAAKPPVKVAVTPGAPVQPAAPLPAPSPVPRIQAPDPVADIGLRNARPEERFSASELQAQRVATARAERAAKLEAKAAEDAAKAQQIEAMKEGLEPTTPSIRESVSAPLPGGGRQSASRSFKAPAEEEVAGGLSAGEMAQLAQQVPDPVKRAQVIARLQGAPSRPIAAPVARPPIRIAPETQARLDAPVAAPVVAPAAPVTPPVVATPVASGPVKEVPVQENPHVGPSRSRGEMSATPGFTIADMESVGLNPGITYKSLPPEVLERIKSFRSMREFTYRINAGLDKGARLASDLEE